MNRYNLFGVLVLILICASCARKPLPAPYPQTSEPVEPVGPSTTVSELSAIEDDSFGKQGPQPPATPDLSEGDYDAGTVDPKFKPLSAGFVNERIFFYQQKLDLWKQLDQQAAIANLDAEQTQVMVDCFRDLQTVLGGYQNLHNQIFQQSGTPHSLNLEYIIGLQRQDIDFLEGRCPQLLGSGGGDNENLTSLQGGDLSVIERQIDELYEAGAYAKVVEFWAALPSYQKDGVSKRTALAYADALIFLNDPAGRPRPMNRLSKHSAPERLSRMIC